MLGTLSLQQMDETLRTQLVGRIGCHAEGMTYIVPISYAFDGSFIYCHTHEGLKTKLMRNNPSICFEVEDVLDMGHWKTVVIQGVYEELNEQQERNQAMDALLKRYLPVISSITTHLGEHWPFRPDDTRRIEGIVFRIRITGKTGRFESSEDSPSLPG